MAQARTPSFFDRLKEGLEHGIREARGEVILKRNELTASDAGRPLTASEVRGIRRRLRITPAVFARVLNVSSQTLKSWESGQSEPSQAALRLLQVIRAHPAVVQEILGWSRRQARTA